MRVTACFCILLLWSGVTLYAQTKPESQSQKIGHADWEHIFRQLPEYKQIETELKTFETQLQNQLKVKTQEFETKYKAFAELPADTPPTIKQDKESELAYLQDNIQKFRQDAQDAIQKKQNDLIAPVLTKIGDAIEAVAKEGGYAYIINPQLVGGGDVVLYADNKYDISGEVLKKLGVKAGG
ncbi:MAG: OmpH family outer membrane protein [Bacteroidia bacterium]|nr:OmpH family outer membrane protein [Bacteroidia bacterium]